MGDMMEAFKSITTVEYIRGVKQSGWKPFDGKLWQRDYYEHIIRDEQSYQRISDYIITNPAKWESDNFYME
jgi:REP element-mobilizing transposase RayT